MSRDRSVNRQIIDEAAEWFVEINEGEPDHITRERFDEWLRRSPEHVRAYLGILPVVEDGARLDALTGDDPLALVAWAKEASNIRQLEIPAAGEQPPREANTSVQSGATRWFVRDARRARRVALAAAAVVLLSLTAALVTWTVSDTGRTYDTGIGDQRLIALNDGSRIELNARSRLRVRYSERERTIVLMEGQALFRVAKDSARPFVVHSGDIIVRAIGTEFDVYRKRTGTRVTVVEGRVAVVASRPVLAEGAAGTTREESAVVLAAGQQAIARRAAVTPPIEANVVSAIAWTQQRLDFSHTPLREVAEEFNRYNERQLVVKGDGLDTFEVSGVFSSSDSASLVRFLRAQPGVRVIETSNEIIVTGSVRE